MPLATRPAGHLSQPLRGPACQAAAAPPIYGERLTAHPYRLPPMSSLTPAPAVYVARYRGTLAGWQPTSTARTPESAARLMALWRRIDPAATLRTLAT